MTGDPGWPRCGDVNVVGNPKLSILQTLGVWDGVFPWVVPLVANTCRAQLSTHQTAFQYQITFTEPSAGVNPTCIRLSDRRQPTGHEVDPALCWRISILHYSYVERWVEEVVPFCCASLS